MSVLPHLFAPLPTPDEMRHWDASAQTRCNIPPALLMENAGREALSVLEEHVSLTAGTRVLVIMGRGNNGGDGAVLARRLHDLGIPVLVCHAGSLSKLPSPAKEHVRMAWHTGIRFLSMGRSDSLTLPPDWRDPAVVVDAVTGTGIRGDLRERELSLVRDINALGRKAFVLALDSPTGLCGYTGKPRPEAVRANVTVSFEAGKPGLYFPEAREYTGTVVVRPVGIPALARELTPPSWRLLSPKAGDWALPAPTQHKGQAGKVLIIGGARGMAGAPLLAALGALRTGAGLVHVACPAGLEPAMRAGWPEVLTHPTGEGDFFTAEDSTSLVELLQTLEPDALVLGPGLGRTEAAKEIVKAILEIKDRCPVVLDADALHFFHLPDYREEATRRHAKLGLPLSLLTEKDILTPHPGEMAKMLPCSFFSHSVGEGPDSLPAKKRGRPREATLSLHACIGELQEDRAGAMRAFTRVCSAILVLKGAGTLIGQRDQPIALAPFAVAALGVGGSGDVLAGACAALAAGGYQPLDAACLGVYLHGRAGELLARQSPRGHLAREIAAAIPQVWSELCGR